MNQEEFFEAEHTLHVSTDKAYRAHLKKLEKLAERQVKAQEALIDKLGEVLARENPEQPKEDSQNG